MAANPDILLLFDGRPAELALYEAAAEKILASFGGVRVLVSKTQVSFKTRAGFAWVWLPVRKIKGRPEHYIILSFGLDYALQSPRLEAVSNPAKNRWTHHFILSAPHQLDQEALGWLAQAHAQSQTRRGRG